MIGWNRQKGIPQESGNFPVVFHKKNNAEILVTMRFDDFMEIYKEYDASQELKEGVPNE